MFEKSVLNQVNKQRYQERKFNGSNRRGKMKGTGFEAVNARAKKKAFDKIRAKKEDIRAKRVSMLRRGRKFNRGFGV